MKLTLLSFILLVCTFSGLQAQDPVLPQEESEPVCEPFFRANYQIDAQTLTIFYEDCNEDVSGIYFCGFGCGNMSEAELNMYENQSRYQLIATDLYGKVLYRASMEKPHELSISGLNLEYGAYLLRMIKPSGESLTHKFGVR